MVSPYWETRMEEEYKEKMEKQKEEKFKKNMCELEIIHKVGIDIWDDMQQLMRGQTGEIKNGTLYLYSNDLNKAYDIVIKENSRYINFTSQEEKP
jgi:hypothetical protein